MGLPGSGAGEGCTPSLVAATGGAAAVARCCPGVGFHSFTSGASGATTPRLAPPPSAACMALPKELLGCRFGPAGGHPQVLPPLITAADPSRLWQSSVAAVLTAMCS